jgi:uncharacterized protein DUF5658
VNTLEEEDSRPTGLALTTLLLPEGRGHDASGPDRWSRVSEADLTGVRLPPIVLLEKSLGPSGSGDFSLSANPCTAPLPTGSPPAGYRVARWSPTTDTMRSLSPPVEAPARPSDDQEAVAPEGPRNRRPLSSALVAMLGGLLVFLVIQAMLAVHNVDVIRDATARGLVDDYSLSLSDRALPALVAGSMGYLIVATVGVAIAAAGRRWLFAVPAAAYAFTTIFVGGSGQPQPIGTQWGYGCFSMNGVCSGPWPASAWAGALVDLGLVLLPGVVVSLRMPSRRWPAIADVPTVAAILAVAAAVAAGGWAIAVIEGYLHLQEFLIVAAAGLLIGTARRWWPWLPILLAAFATGALGWIWEPILFPDPNFSFGHAWPYVLDRTWPLVAVGLVASAWQPLAWLLRRAKQRPMSLVIAVNLLNVGDAVLTALAVSSGGALEANPLVRIAGLPAKVALVGLLTWLLYRRRPTALVWPAAALVAVSAYHVTGILVNGWR